MVIPMKSDIINWTNWLATDNRDNLENFTAYLTNAVAKPEHHIPQSYQHAILLEPAEDIRVFENFDSISSTTVTVMVTDSESELDEGIRGRRHDIGGVWPGETKNVGEIKYTSSRGIQVQSSQVIT